VVLGQLFLTGVHSFNALRALSFYLVPMIASLALLAHFTGGSKRARDEKKEA